MIRRLILWPVGLAVALTAAYVAALAFPEPFFA
jgi:hypothetical protein